MRGSWRPNRTATYWLPLLWPSALCLSRSPGLFNRWTGGPAECWLPLPHLVTNGSGLQTNWLPVFTELYNSSIAHSISPHIWPSEMCHFRCLWNGMFDFHRAEITVMQFTGHSLPVHQSDCTVGFYLVPYCQPSPPTPMEYATSASLEWHVWPGRRSIYNTWIFLTLSRHSSLSFIASGRSSGRHPISTQSCWMYVRASHPAFARPYEVVHRSISLMSSTLLLLQCPTCLVRLILIVFVMGGRWSYSCCFVGCCLQDLFDIARSILV